MAQICKRLVKDYCANSTVAGIRFIADDTKHCIERIVWVALVVLSWYGSVMLMISAWDAFVFHPISFGVETTYTDWNTEMPTIAICEKESELKVFAFADTYWPPDHSPDLEDALKEIVFFRGSCNALLTNCYTPKSPDPICPLSNYSYYVTMIRRKCPELLQQCSYNDKPFSCCDYFQHIETDTGPCFILNSIQTKNPMPLPMIANQTHKRAVIKFETLAEATTFTLAPDEVPCLSSSQTSLMEIKLGFNYSRHITIRSIQNDPLTVQTTIEQRACRFYTENQQVFYPFYSYSGCVVECRKKAQMENCQCMDHLMPGATEKERCNITGLACLHSKKAYLTTLKPPWRKTPGLVCNCLPSCNENEITVVKDVHLKNNKGISAVELVLAYLPTERFKRNVVRSRLDLVVYVGGTAGLFVGASILSFVEFIFFFTFRLGSNFLMDWQKRKSKQSILVKPKTEDIGKSLNVSCTLDPQQAPYQNSGIGPSIIFYNKFHETAYLHKLGKIYPK